MSDKDNKASCFFFQLRRSKEAQSHSGTAKDWYPCGREKVMLEYSLHGRRQAYARAN